MQINKDDPRIKIITDWLGTGAINVFGVPLAGKDTQCELLSELLGSVTFGGGDILRNSKTSDALQTDINSGKLAPTDEYLSLILPYFSRDEFTGKSLVLSSIGRWSGEETVVIDAANKSGHPIKASILLELTPEEAHARLEDAQRDRDDDAAHILEVRFTEFEQKTRPVLTTYAHQDLLISVDGNQPVEAVTEAIVEGLLQKAQA